MVNLFTVGLTLETVGTIMLGLLVLLVHRRVLKEHKINKSVIKEMHLEQLIGVIAIILITFGYILQILK